MARTGGACLGTCLIRLSLHGCVQPFGFISTAQHTACLKLPLGLHQRTTFMACKTAVCPLHAPCSPCMRLFTVDWGLYLNASQGSSNLPVIAATVIAEPCCTHHQLRPCICLVYRPHAKSTCISRSMSPVVFQCAYTVFSCSLPVFCSCLYWG